MENFPTMFYANDLDFSRSSVYNRNRKVSLWREYTQWMLAYKKYTRRAVFMHRFS